MNKKMVLTLTAIMLMIAMLAGCGAGSAETTPPTAEPTAAPTQATAAPTGDATEAPTEAPVEVLRHPLTGEVLEEPETGRIFAVTINNVNPALPHVGVNDADIFFEMYINDYATRGLALYTDINEVPEIGSVRSTRYNFTDIAVSYDAFVAHAGGSDEVLSDVKKSGIDHKNIDTSATDPDSGYSFRSKARMNDGIGKVHSLMVNGTNLYEWAKEQGLTVEYDEPRTYGLSFAEDGTPADGENAATVNIRFKLDGTSKTTTMVYDAAASKYVYNEYGESLVDGSTGEDEAFTNVFVLKAPCETEGKYHIYELEGSGEGYYACGGKLIPIQWHRENEHATFTFTLADGNALSQGVGNSYIALVPVNSEISWE